ncbi:hypothetical protein [Candidatus Williamhamiltonella defendens]|uniref:hypothetical protein n=1 Tax=Candidatus Williamhamiltonella defendens TaxID=138072 RepID=UPI001651370F|nr:hypothetical protein [Candidatus Hamiltonella defensa]
MTSGVYFLKCFASFKGGYAFLIGADPFIEKGFDAGAGDDRYNQNILHGGEGNTRIIATGTGNKILYENAGGDKIFIYQG